MIRTASQRLGFASALVLFVGGCATYRAEPLDPAAELLALNRRAVADAIIEHASLPPAPSAASTHFDPSDGLDESEVVAVALVLNPQIRAMRLEIGESQALLISAGYWPNPEFDIDWRAGVGGSSGSNIAADLLFQLLSSGVRSVKHDIAQARIDQTKSDILAAEFALVADVRLQWLRVRSAENTMRLLDEELELRQRSLDLIRQRRKLGEGTELEISVSDLELAEVRRDRRKAETELDADRRDLNQLLGLPPEYELKLSDSTQPLVATIYPDLSDEELSRRLLTGRPELTAKTAEYERAEHELRLAVLKQYPNLKIGPSFEHDLDESNSLGAMLSLELPIFDRNQGEIAEKGAHRDRVRGEYVALLHKLRGEAYAARAGLKRSRLEIETQEKEVLPLIKRNQELFEAAFRARDLNVVDWVTAQQRAVRARREYLDSVTRYRESLIRLEAATGQPLRSPTTRPSATSAFVP